MIQYQEETDRQAAEHVFDVLAGDQIGRTRRDRARRLVDDGGLGRERRDG